MDKRSIKRILPAYYPQPRYFHGPRSLHVSNLLQRYPIRCAAVVTPSKWLTRKSIESPRIDSLSYNHIYNPTTFLDSSGLNIPQGQAKASIGVSCDAPAILLIANDLSNTHKGIAYAIEAISIAAKFVNFQVLLVGQQSNLVKELLVGIVSVSSFLASSDDVLIAAYRSADIVLIPSLSESLCYVALEAFSCSRPIISFPVGGLQEVVGFNERGRLATQVSSYGLAVELLHLLNRPALSTTLGESAKHWVAKNCSWELFGSRLMNVYSQALEDYYAGNMALV
jgi:glycosyltransferase involved in cell wall biosynthesis